MDNVIKSAAKIKLVVFDVDGVLTDGTLFIGDDGQQYKGFNVRDGLGIKMLQQIGIPVAIITAKVSNVVKLRMDELGIEYVFQGQKQKFLALQSLAQSLNLALDEIAYVGDDVIDLPVLTKVGFAVAVADAHDLVKHHAHWITTNKGGRGAAREVCELILQSQGKLDALFNNYLD